MRKIRLTIEYDGTGYVGWQVQPNGLSVQEELEKALGRVVGEGVRLVSSGRTDAGVHARGMVAHLETASDLPLSAFREGVNRFLPPAVAVREAREAPSDFHARFQARGKWYRYQLWVAAVRSPLEARTSWHLRGPLDLEAMRRGAALLAGRHDFAAFRTTGGDAETTVRELYSVEVRQARQRVVIDFRGQGYLRNMVRILVGTLVEIGLGRRPVEDIPRLLELGEKGRAGPTAPPQGLCLMEVWY